MLGPEGHLYNPLPSPTAIRILLLAPGKADDDVFCFLFPCDLDKDRAIDPSIPRPFESLCIASAIELGNGEETKRFMLPLDSYIDDDDKTAPLSTNLELTNSKRREVLQDSDGKHQSAQNASESQAERARESKAINEANNLGLRSQQAEQGADSEQFDYDSAESEAEQRHEDPSDDVWDLIQLMRLTQANGALDDRVHRHPFQRYTALSYVWGSVDEPACITIEGDSRFWVTRNLFEALKCLRRPDVARALWIDAICINQDDPEEKKVQISLMRRVYKQAQKVIAYVPQAREDTESFNKLVRKILQADIQCRKVIASGVNPDQYNKVEDLDIRGKAGSQQPQENAAPISDAPDVDVKILPLKPTGTCIEDYDVPSEDDPAWGAWRRFFASPYFRRIWILQEYALARELHFEFGYGKADADIILVLMDAVDRRSRLLNAHYLGRGENFELTRAAALGWMGLEKMSIQRVLMSYDIDNKDKVENQNLIDKLDTGMLFEATDPRDKIYALLGLVSDADQFDDLISYDPLSTYNQVYSRFAKRLIEKGCFMQILNMACRTPLSPPLPSWVPNWSAPTGTSLVATVPWKKGFCSGGNQRSISAHFPPQNQGQLILSGHIFCAITFKTSAFVPYSQKSPLSTGLYRLQDFFETLLAVMSELRTHLDPEIPIMDIFHILTMQSHRVESVDRDSPNSSGILNDLRLFRTLLGRAFQYSKIEGHADHKVVFGALPEEDRDFIQKLLNHTMGRCFCITNMENRIGLVPERAQVGDHVAIFVGAPVPFVLREASEGVAEAEKAYRIVGDAFVTGVMQGELAQPDEDVGKQIILI